MHHRSATARSARTRVPTQPLVRARAPLARSLFNPSPPSQIARESNCAHTHSSPCSLIMLCSHAHKHACAAHQRATNASVNTDANATTNTTTTFEYETIDLPVLGHGGGCCGCCQQCSTRAHRAPTQPRLASVDPPDARSEQVPNEATNPSESSAPTSVNRIVHASGV
jgi:hypothetical protein